jgi:hypothetical protein
LSEGQTLFFLNLDLSLNLPFTLADFFSILLGAEAETKKHGNACCIILR